MIKIIKKLDSESFYKPLKPLTAEELEDFDSD